MHCVVETRLPVDLRLTLGPLAHAGRADPCVQVGHGEVWRATRHVAGPATVRFRSLGPCVVEVDAWGPGAAEAIDSAPALLGEDDDDGGLLSDDDPSVRDMARRFVGLRMSRSGNVLEALVPTILGQKVQGPSAKASFRAMVRACGDRAPSVAGAPRLLLPPAAAWLVAQPLWAWHRWGVEGKRAMTIRTAASYAHRLEECRDSTFARERLMALPGVGVWAAAEVTQIAFGDADAVTVGDYWLKHWVAYNLGSSARGSDEEMLHLLAPWAPQRGRLCRLIMLGGEAPPRFGPKLAMEPIAAI